MNYLTCLLDNLEAYVLYKNGNSAEFNEEYSKVKGDCALLYEGSSVHKYIHIIRWAAECMDGKGADKAFLRKETDGITESGSPHIVAVQVGSLYIFELWVERTKLLGNLDLPDSIAAFIHLCFTFGLEYPEGAPYFCDYVQRVLADYGDESGTKTGKSKSTAENKLAKFFEFLGKAKSTKKKGNSLL